MSYQRIFSTPIDELVSHGKFNFGTYPQAVKNLNLLDVKKPFSLPTPDWFVKYRLKEWQAFQFSNNDYFVLAVIYSAKIIALSQLIIVDKKRNTKTKYEILVPAWRVSIAQGLHDSYSRIDEPNHKITVYNDLANHQVVLDMDINHSQLGRLTGHLVANHSPTESASMTICHPFSASRALYSHKNLMPVTGFLQISTDKIEFEAANSWMIMDDHKGMYPYTMEYDWLTAAHVNEQGQRIGFNLTDNQIQNHYLYNENCLWINNSIELLPPISIQRPNGVERMWLINDEFGCVNLRFMPSVPSEVKINTPIARTEYYGPYGWIMGYIINQQGQKINFDNTFGMGEQKFIQC